MVLLTVLRWMCVSTVSVTYRPVRSPGLRTVSNMYICNMALADILICVVAAPITPLTAFTGSWHFGAALCRLVPFIQVSTGG